MHGLVLDSPMSHFSGGQTLRLTYLHAPSSTSNVPALESVCVKASL